MTEAEADLYPAIICVKHCSKCSLVKPVTQFYKCQSKRDGHLSLCIPCRKIIKGIAARVLKREADAKQKRVAMELELLEKERMRERMKEIWQQIRNPINEDWYARMEAVREVRESSRKARRAERELENRKANPERHKEKAKRWRERHPHTVKAIRQRWVLANREIVSELNKRYRESKADCPLFNLAKRVRSTTRAAFKRKKLRKTNGTIDMLGCTWQHLRAHIQKQFKPGMDWENMNLWHIDHIVPLASARDEVELMKLAHFSNLRPLWAAENMAKGDSIITCQPELTLNMA